MSPEPFVSRAKALPAKRSERGDGDENDEMLDESIEEELLKEDEGDIHLIEQLIPRLDISP